MSSRAKKLIVGIVGAVGLIALLILAVRARSQPEARAPGVLPSARGAKAMRPGRGNAAPAAAASDAALAAMPGSILGRVTGPGGGLPAGVTVMVAREPQPRGSGPIQKFTAQVFGDGSFRADDLPPGLDYVVQARTPSLVSAENRGLEVQPGGATDAGTLVLTEGGELSVRVVDASDQPVPRADVALRREENLSSLDELYERFEARGITDDEGRVYFSALAPGPKVVAALAEGAPAAVLHNKAIAEAKELELTIKLAPALALAGVVTTLEGAPIAGADVEATDRSHSFATSAAAVTDASGHFVIRGLPMKTLRVQATAKGYAADERDRVAPGVTDLHLVLEAAGGVQGSVSSTVGARVENFQLRLFSLDRAGDASRAEAFSDGEFLMHEVPPGRYRLEVVAADFAPGGVDELVVRPGQVSGPHKVVLGAGESLDGIVADVEGDVVEGARVTLMLGNASRDGFMNRHAMLREPVHEHNGDPSAALPMARTDTVSDADGKFHFSHVARGKEMTLVATHPLYPETRVVTSDRQVRIVMEEPGQIAGRVVREGKGVPGQMVWMDGGNGSVRAVTAADGRFVSGPLLAGRYQVAVLRGAEFREGNMPDHRDFKAVMVDKGKRSEVTLTLDPAPDTAVVVCEVSNDSSPASGVTVRISRMEDFYNGSCITGADGSCSIPGVPTGEVLVAAIVDNEQDRDRSLQQKEIIPEVPVHRIELSIPQRKLAGVVFVASDGSPVAGARVTINTIGDQNDGVGEGAFFTTQTDALGKFTIDHLPSGTYRVAAAKAGYARRILDAVNINGYGRSAETIRLDLAPGGWVDITITDETGKGLLGVAFNVETPEGEPVFVLSSVGTETTDASGRAYFDVLPPKPLVVRTYPRKGWQPLEWKIQPEAGKRIEISGVLKRIPGEPEEPK